MSIITIPSLPSVRELARMPYESRHDLYAKRAEAARLKDEASVPDYANPAVCPHGHAWPTLDTGVTLPRPRTSQGRYSVAKTPLHDGWLCYGCEDSRSNVLVQIRDYGLSEKLEFLEACKGSQLTFTEVRWACQALIYYGAHSLTLTPEGAKEFWVRTWTHFGARTRTHTLVSVTARENERAEQDVRVRTRMSEQSQNERHARLENIRRRMTATPTDKARADAAKAPADVTLTAAEQRIGRFRSEPECTCSRDEDGDILDSDEDCEACNSGSDDDYDNGRHGDRKSPQHGMPFLAGKADKVRRLVGVELEFNNRTNITRWIRKWRGAVHTDGSCGYEAVTTPIGGGHITQCMLDLCKDLRANETQADERCGIHVHVDAGDVTWADMCRLIKVYAKVEPVLYLLAGQQRLVQNYCKPVGAELLQAVNSSDYKENVMRIAYQSGNGRERAKERPGKKDGGRYRGMNIIPWLVGRRTRALDTTIEFRMHRNSLDGARVAGWAHLMAALVEYAVKATDKEVDALPKSALRALCDHVSPEQRRWILKRVLAWRNVTTAEKSNRSDITGQAMAKRRISFKKGTVSSCAV